MVADDRKIKEIRENVLERKPKEYKKKVSIIYDGKQYSIRIPREFAEQAKINPKEDMFEFILEIPEDKTDLPMLSGDLVEKEEDNSKG